MAWTSWDVEGSACVSSRSEDEGWKYVNEEDMLMFFFFPPEMCQQPLLVGQPG
jgi:hypothetical protein